MVNMNKVVNAGIGLVVGVVMLAIVQDVIDDQEFSGIAATVMDYIVPIFAVVLLGALAATFKLRA